MARKDPAFGLGDLIKFRSNNAYGVVIDVLTSARIVNGDGECAYRWREVVWHGEPGGESFHFAGECCHLESKLELIERDWRL